MKEDIIKQHLREVSLFKELSEKEASAYSRYFTYANLQSKVICIYAG